eukprot:355039-Chlamydomonas_euryale.AAC.4
MTQAGPPASHAAGGSRPPEAAAVQTCLARAGSAPPAERTSVGGGGASLWQERQVHAWQEQHAHIGQGKSECTLRAAVVQPALFATPNLMIADQETVGMVAGDLPNPQSMIVQNGKHYGSSGAGRQYISLHAFMQRRPMQLASTVKLSKQHASYPALQSASKERVMTCQTLFRAVASTAAPNGRGLPVLQATAPQGCNETCAWHLQARNLRNLRPP